MTTQAPTQTTADTTRQRELCAAVADLDDGTGDVGVIVRCALADDPDATAEDVRAIVVAAREDAAEEAARE